MLDHHAALIYVAVLASAADKDVTDCELATINEVVAHWPVFRDYDRDRMSATANACIDLLQAEDGLDRAVAAIRAGLPESLYETAYALACDVAAADGRANQEELRLLELLSEGLGLGRLQTAAIEYATRIRHRVA